MPFALLGSWRYGVGITVYLGFQVHSKTMNFFPFAIESMESHFFQGNEGVISSNVVKLLSLDAP